MTANVTLNFKFTACNFQAFHPFNIRLIMNFGILNKDIFNIMDMSSDLVVSITCLLSILPLIS
jgi:hypothetical protein